MPVVWWSTPVTVDHCRLKCHGTIMLTLKNICSQRVDCFSFYPIFTSSHSLPSRPRAGKQLQNTVGTVTMIHFYYKIKKKNMCPLHLSVFEIRRVHVQFKQSFGLSVR